MKRFWASILAAMAMLTASSAVAEPHYVMSSSDKIDLVRDLPNDAAFVRDGQYYDLGYLYSTERVNGADVPRQGVGFVLYHDDRYAKLGPSEIAAITEVLGEDPTEGYIPPVANAPRGMSAREVAWGPQPAASPIAVPDRGSSSRHAGIGIGGALTIFLVLMIRVRALREFVLGGLLRAAFHRRRTAADPVPTVYGDPFEHRVAQRLAELEVSRNESPAAVPPPQRTFGRKVA